jgi:hypothetical protein
MGGPPISGNVSLSIMMVSSIFMLACMSLPPGPGERLVSTALNARFRNSMYAAQPGTVRCTVTVPKPGETG